MTTTLFRGHPEQYLHTLARTHYTLLKSKPSCAAVWALGVLASPFHFQLALFLMFMRCCASGFGSVETFLAAPAFCTGFAAFSYYPTTLWFSSFFPVEFEETVRSLRAPKQQFKPQQHTFRPHFHPSIKRRKKCGRGVFQNTSSNPKTILSGTGAGPRKKTSATSEESYGLAIIFHTCNKHKAFLLFLKGGSPVGPAAAAATTTTTTPPPAAAINCCQCFCTATTSDLFLVRCLMFALVRTAGQEALQLHNARACPRIPPIFFGARYSKV